MTASATAPAKTGVTIPRSEIARALRAAASIKSKAIHIDLDGDTPQTTAYTPDVAVRMDLDADSTGAAGALFAPRPLLAGVLAYCGPDVTLTIAEDGNTLSVESNDSTFELRAMRPDVAGGKTTEKRARRGAATSAPVEYDGTFGHDFAPPTGEPVTIEAPVFVETLRRTLPFASRDMTRPILATVALYPDAHCAVATDSYRLAIVRYGDDGPSDDPILLTVAGAQSLQQLLAKKLGQVEIYPTDRPQICFDYVRWSLRRVYVSESGGYPKWRQLLPDTKTTTTIKVDRDDLLTAARAAGVIATKNAPLRLHVEKGETTVRAHVADSAAMTRRLGSADVDGESMEIGLNPTFVSALCASAPVERLTVKLIAPLRPIVVEAARDLYLLMPIRLNA